MVKWKCLACKTTVVTFHGHQPRSCKACGAREAWMMAVDSTDGVLPGIPKDANLSSLKARWIPD